MFAIPFSTDAPYRVAAEFISTSDATGEQKLAGLSMTLLRSELQSTGGEALLRMEWVAEGDNPREVSNAQPHWHVYGSKLEEMALANRAADVNPRGLERVHLAMAARWHEDAQAPIYISLDSSNIERWVRGILLYLRSQLSYLKSRRSA